MGRQKHSEIKKQHRGCLTGCLTRLLVLLGLAALLFVLACMTGIITNDEQTGEPIISFDHIHAPDISNVHLDVSGVQKMVSGLAQKIPSFNWPYGVPAQGLTVKVLHAGDGESLLVCSDGYIMVADAGSGSGYWIAGQMLLGGVKHINVLAALSSDDTNINGMKTLLGLFKPEYLLYQSSQTKTEAYNRMLAAAEKQSKLQRLSASTGMSFRLGRADVSIVGPRSTYHSSSMNDGLSLCLSYGQTRILMLGTVLEDGAMELQTAGSPIRADVLIVGNGGAALTTQLLSTVGAQYVLVAGKPDEGALSRARTSGATVYTVKENGIMTIHTDGDNLTFSK